MTLTPRSQGNNLHDSRRRQKRPRLSPIKPESEPEPDRFPSLSMGSNRNDLVPPSGLHRLPRPPSLPNPLPPPPVGGHVEQMTEWLRAKAEEDRRKQAEERTQQETLILEQRRIEQAMLADSLRAGVPPHLLPLIFGAFQHSAAAVQGAATAPQSSSLPEFQQLSVASRAAQAQTQSQPPSLPSLPSFSAQASQQGYQGPLSSRNPPPSQAQQPAQAPGQPVQQSPSELTSMVFNQRTPQYHRRNAPRLDLVGERLNMQTITIPGPSVAYSHDRSGFRQSIPFMGPASTHPRSMEYHGQAQSSGTRYTTAPPQYPPPPNWTWDYRQPPPLAFHHWTPPENLQAQSQSQPQSQTQNPATPTLDSSAPAKPSASNLRSGQNSPIHKRKDERSHRKVPPPSSRVPDASAERQDPNDSSRRIWSQPHRRQISDVSSTRGARDNDEGESSEQFSEMTPIPTDLSSTHNTSDSAVGTSQTQEVGVGSRHASSKRQ